MAGILRRNRWRGMQSDRLNRTENISYIIKNRAAKFRSDLRKPQREAQFLIENQQRLATDRKSGDRIARPGLIKSKSAQRCAAAREESFGQRNIRGKSVAQRLLHAEACSPCEHEPFRQRVVS